MFFPYIARQVLQVFEFLQGEIPSFVMPFASLTLSNEGKNFQLYPPRSLKPAIPAIFLTKILKINEKKIPYADWGQMITRTRDTIIDNHLILLQHTLKLII